MRGQSHKRDAAGHSCNAPLRERRQRRIRTLAAIPLPIGGVISNAGHSLKRQQGQNQHYAVVEGFFAERQNRFSFLGDSVGRLLAVAVYYNTAKNQNLTPSHPSITLAGRFYGMMLPGPYPSHLTPYHPLPIYCRGLLADELKGLYPGHPGLSPAGDFVPGYYSVAAGRRRFPLCH